MGPGCVHPRCTDADTWFVNSHVVRSILAYAATVDFAQAEEVPAQAPGCKHPDPVHACVGSRSLEF